MFREVNTLIPIFMSCSVLSGPISHCLPSPLQTFSPLLTFCHSVITVSYLSLWVPSSQWCGFPSSQPGAISSGCEAPTSCLSGVAPPRPFTPGPVLMLLPPLIPACPLNIQPCRAHSVSRLHLGQANLHLHCRRAALLLLFATVCFALPLRSSSFLGRSY